MSIKLEYIVCNKKGDELKRFDIKADADLVHELDGYTSGQYIFSTNNTTKRTS